MPSASQGSGGWAMVAGAPLSLRGAALMPAAVLALHQLRYKLAFGAESSNALATQGHAYLSSLVPWIVLLAGLSLGATVGSLVQRWAVGSERRSARVAFVRVWLLVAVALLTAYAGQELLEGTFASGHLAGLAAVFGAGGWWAIPAALLVGGMFALALRTVAAAEAAIDSARGAMRCRGGLREGVAWRPVAGDMAARRAPMAAGAAGRAPPHLRLIHV